MCIVISNVCAKCNNIFLLVLLTSEKGNVFFHSYMISILEKAKLFDIKYEKKSKSLYWHIIFLLSIWTGSILYFFRYILYIFILTICSRHKKKRIEGSARMHSVQFFAHQTAVFVHIEYNYYHAACTHKVSTFLFYLFVTHSIARFFFSLSLSFSFRLYICVCASSTLFSFLLRLYVLHTRRAVTIFFCRALCA